MTASNGRGYTGAGTNTTHYLISCTSQPNTAITYPQQTIGRPYGKPAKTAAFSDAAAIAAARSTSLRPTCRAMSLRSTNSRRTRSARRRHSTARTETTMESYMRSMAQPRARPTPIASLPPDRSPNSSISHLLVLTTTAGSPASFRQVTVICIAIRSQAATGMAHSIGSPSLASTRCSRRRATAPSQAIGSRPAMAISTASPTAAARRGPAAWGPYSCSRQRCSTRLWRPWIGRRGCAGAA